VTPVTWRPGATPDVLRLRAGLLARTRTFFAARGVLEVQTPVLGRHGVTDVHIETIGVPLAGHTWHLQSSPEYAMKRLLAAGSGDIYQVGPAFRHGEAGRLHNPEFTLLEWYRVGCTLDALVDETLALLAALLDRPATASRRSYRQLFDGAFGVDAFAAAPRLAAAAREAGLAPSPAVAADAGMLRDLLYDTAVSVLGAGLHVIVDFPVAAAALARVEPAADGTPVARRFEVIADGIEIANGYDELTDAVEQRRRFEADAAARARAGAASRDIDERLLAALASGLPRCAGVAVGFDRVVLIAAGAGSLDSVLAFSHARA
jgi:lysyl-tRNA synthetase class 2